MSDLIVNLWKSSGYIHEIRGKRLTAMPIIAAVDSAIQSVIGNGNR